MFRLKRFGIFYANFKKTEQYCTRFGLSFDMKIKKGFNIDNAFLGRNK
uniref:Uncharacterized protein n=1 Tax=Meloidogyne enterolobii TaxID=390850 RepID=A0A6V7UGN3_MELEN|nr:unnamed protein product [Meloidogyne enterolobii]